MKTGTNQIQKEIKTPIIPVNQTFRKLPDMEFKPDYKAICVFAALGFFLEDDTYYQNRKVLKPATEYSLEDGTLNEQSAWFEWHYTPENKPFYTWVNEFGALFEKIIDEQTDDHKRVILPLSGGLDSRTQAVALKRLGKKVSGFCYRFQGGHNETYYGRKIAQQCGFDFYPRSEYIFVVQCSMLICILRETYPFA